MHILQSAVRQKLFRLFQQTLCFLSHFPKGLGNNNIWIFKMQQSTTARMCINRQNPTALSLPFQGLSCLELEQLTSVARALIKEVH